VSDKIKNKKEIGPIGIRKRTKLRESWKVKGHNHLKYKKIKNKIKQKGKKEEGGKKSIMRWYHQKNYILRLSC
jgi:hypothetical protein